MLPMRLVSDFLVGRHRIFLVMVRPGSAVVQTATALDALVGTGAGQEVLGSEKIASTILDRRDVMEIGRANRPDFCLRPIWTSPHPIAVGRIVGRQRRLPVLKRNQQRINPPTVPSRPMRRRPIAQLVAQRNADRAAGIAVPTFGADPLHLEWIATTRSRER